VELANPCAFEVYVESISLSVYHGMFDAFPVSLTLTPQFCPTIVVVRHAPFSWHIGNLGLHCEVLWNDNRTFV